MDEKVLLEWKEAHVEVYAKFKEDLEGQLQKPYHQNILDLGDGNEAIRERLLHKNPYLFSLYYWIIFDNGFLHAADRLF